MRISLHSFDRLRGGRSAAAPALFLAALGMAMFVTPARAVASACGEVRSYRTSSSQGTPILILTNLDEAGNRIGGDCPSEPDTPPHAPGPAIPGAGGDGTGPAGSPVRVVVNQGEGGNSGGQQVEINTDDHGGTTVIVNINPPPSEKETVPLAPQASYPVYAVGGLPGPFRYPDHLYFLGYGPDNSSPSFFSGLGLNPGNGYGSKHGASCDHGYDCMFGRPPSRP